MDHTTGARLGRDAYQRGLEAMGVPPCQARTWASARMPAAAGGGDDARRGQARTPDPAEREKIMLDSARARAELDAFNARRQARRDRNAASEQLGREAFDRADRGRLAAAALTQLREALTGMPVQIR